MWVGAIAFLPSSVGNVSKYLKGKATATGPKISSMTTVEAELTLVIKVGG